MYGINQELDGSFLVLLLLIDWLNLDRLSTREKVPHLRSTKRDWQYHLNAVIRGKIETKRRRGRNVFSQTKKLWKWKQINNSSSLTHNGGNSYDKLRDNGSHFPSISPLSIGSIDKTLFNWRFSLGNNWNTRPDQRREKQKTNKHQYTYAQTM